MKSRKLTIVSGLAAVALAAVGIALALVAPVSSKEGGVDTSSDGSGGGTQGQMFRSLGL
jgi:hypothetical protein